MPPVISLNCVQVKRTAILLNNLTWKVYPGEKWVIMGANGSGKSSLMKLITGYIQPSKGEVKVLSGRVDETDGWPDIRKHIAIVSHYIAELIEEDQYAGDVILSGSDSSINFWGEASVAQIKRTKEVLSKINAWHLCNRKWGDLSQGEKQKILIGRALMNNNKLIILDEPCSGLDPAARESYLQFIDNMMLKHPDLTILLVTHYVEEITPEFSHVLLLKKGEIYVSGKKNEVISDTLLSSLFNVKVTIQKANNRFFSRVEPSEKNVF